MQYSGHAINTCWGYYFSYLCADSILNYVLKQYLCVQHKLQCKKWPELNQHLSNTVSTVINNTFHKGSAYYRTVVWSRWFLHFLSLSVHYKNCPSSHEGVFSPTSQSEVKQVTDVPVTAWYLKQINMGVWTWTIDLLPFSARERTAFLTTRQQPIERHMPGTGQTYTFLNMTHLDSSQAVNKKRPRSWSNAFTLETSAITKRFHHNCLWTTSSWGNSYYIGINWNKSDSNQVRLIETAKPAPTHLLANTQLHLGVWLALVEHL